MKEGNESVYLALQSLTIGEIVIKFMDEALKETVSICNNISQLLKHSAAADTNPDFKEVLQLDRLTIIKHTENKKEAAAKKARTIRAKRKQTSA